MCLKKGKVMVMIVLLMSLLCSTISATVNPIPGENLWRLVSRIALTVDIIQSDVCALLSEVEIVESVVDKLVADFISVADLLTSQADDIDMDIESAQEILISLIENVTIDLNSIGDVFSSEIEHLDGDLLSVSDVLTSELEIIDNAIISMQDTLSSQLDVIEVALEDISSAIEHVDANLLSATDDILSAIEQLEDCLVGIPVMQSDFIAGTFTINQPGVYTLCENITMTSADPAINVATSDVQINLNGYTLTVDVTGIAVSGQSNVKINNGFIVNNAAGSALSISTSSQNIVIEDITAFLGGISIDTSTGITISRYVGQGSASTVVLSNSASIVVQDSSVGDAAVGFVVSGSSNILLDCCEAFGVETGFSIQNNALGVLLRNCYTSDTFNGFLCTNLSSAGFVMEYCTSEFSDVGFLVNGVVTGGEFIECSVSGSSLAGFDLAGSSLLLKRCVAANNTVGIRVENSASDIQILDTCPVNNTTNFVDNGTATTFINLGTVEEILLSVLEGIETCVCSSMEHLLSTLDDINNNTVSSVDAASSVVDLLETCLVGTSIKNADLPLTIDQPGVYTVCESLVYGGVNPAITIGANNVVINFNGYTLTTTNQGIVCSGFSNVQIYNATIQAGSESIAISSVSQGIVLRNITLYQPADVGILISDSSGVVIDHCIINGNGGGVTGNANPGAIYLSNSGGVLVKDCVINSINAAAPARGISIVEVGTGGIELQSCSVSGTTAEAFRISSASSNLDNVLVKDCVAIGNGDGFLVIHITGSALGPILDHCISESNGLRGFTVMFTQATALLNCAAISNTSSGFLFDSSTTQSVASSCISQDNGVGFTISGTSTTLRWCTASNNANQGFFIDVNALNTVIDDSLASRNGGAGILNGVLPTASSALTMIVDTRSQSVATPPLNPVGYNLNGALDFNASAVIVRTS
jgi:hypothetical protein